LETLTWFRKELVNYIIVFGWYAYLTSEYLFPLQNLGNYFKQSAKALEQKINREARFYGALIRFEYLLFI